MEATRRASEELTGTTRGGRLVLEDGSVFQGPDIAREPARVPGGAR
jgi:hypothetical protein